MTIADLWKESEEKKGLKVRYIDWHHGHRFFTIEQYDAKNSSFVGRLDCGEKITYPSNSLHWKLYEEGDEEMARAS